MVILRLGYRAACKLWEQQPEIEMHDKHQVKVFSSYVVLNFASSQHHASSPVALNFAFSQHNSHVALNLGFTNITHMLHWIWGLPTSFTCCTEFCIFPTSVTCCTEFGVYQHHSHVALNLGFTNIIHMLHWILHFPNIIHMLHWISGLPTSFTCCTEFCIFPTSFTCCTEFGVYQHHSHVVLNFAFSPTAASCNPTVSAEKYLISHFLRCGLQTPIGPFKHRNDSMTLTACGRMQVSALLVLQLQLH